MDKMVAEAEKILQAAEEEAKTVGGENDKQLGRAWDSVLHVLGACLGKSHAAATAVACEKYLHIAYRVLSAKGAPFKAVRPSSRQAVRAKNLFDTFRPKERQVCGHSL